MVYSSLCCSSGSFGECVRVPHNAPQQLRKTQPRWQQELTPLFLSKQPHQVTMQHDLLIPGNARDQMVDHMARLTPRPSTHQQPRETSAETSRADLVFQRHQVVLGE